MEVADARPLLEFLATKRVATIAVPIDETGTLHIATMHYFHKNEPFSFYFVTQKSSEKCRLLVRQNEVMAACTIGTVEGVPFTLQMRGHARLLEIAKNPELMNIYFVKRQSKNRNVEGEGATLVEFIPDWARFTDYSKGWDTTMLDLK